MRLCNGTISAFGGMVIIATASTARAGMGPLPCSAPQCGARLPRLRGDGPHNPGRPIACNRLPRRFCQGSRQDLSGSERLERTALGYRRFRCRSCGKQFSERSGSMLNRAQYPLDVIAVVVLWHL